VISVDKSRVVINDRTSKRHRSCGIRGRRRVTSDIAFDVIAARSIRSIRALELPAARPAAATSDDTVRRRDRDLPLRSLLFTLYTHTHQLIYARARTRDAGHTLAYSLPPPDDKHGCRAL